MTSSVKAARGRQITSVGRRRGRRRRGRRREPLLHIGAWCGLKLQQTSRLPYALLQPHAQAPELRHISFDPGAGTGFVRLAKVDPRTKRRIYAVSLPLRISSRRGALPAISVRWRSR